MLSVDRISTWQKFFNLLSNLPNVTSSEIIPDLRESIELFESEIITQNFDDLADPIAAKMRSYITESHRLLRLLPMDLMFITAARNTTTRQARLQAYQVKLDLLCQYCQAVIDT